MEKINIMALRHSAFYSPLLMAMAGGFLKEEGLAHHYTLASPDNTVPDNLARGSCHVAQSAVATRFAELEKGIESDVVHFAQINNRDGFFLVAREQDAHFSWEKLIDKNVLVDHFFQPLAMFRYALFKQGIDANAVNFIDAGDVDAMDKAFREGEGDYIHQQGPAPQQLQKEGKGFVVASIGQAVGPVAFSSLCATGQWLDTDMANAFLRAYQKSMGYVITASAADIAQQEIEANFFPGIAPDVLTQTIKDYQALGCWEHDTHISTTSFDHLQDVFLHNQVIGQRYEYDEIIMRC
jgi:NitT/TauT family transport system substrate-binding protein